MLTDAARRLCNPLSSDRYSTPQHILLCAANVHVSYKRHDVTVYKDNVIELVIGQCEQLYSCYMKALAPLCADLFRKC